MGVDTLNHNHSPLPQNRIKSDTNDFFLNSLLNVMRRPFLIFWKCFAIGISLFTPILIIYFFSSPFLTFTFIFILSLFQYSDCSLLLLFFSSLLFTSLVFC